MDIFDVENKVILYTGGYGHLGKEPVKYLAKHQARVYVLARDINKFQEAFDEENILFQACDIADSSSIQAAFRDIYRKEGKLDVLVNNAFYSRGQSPETMSDEDFAYGIQGTLDSAFICIREIIPYFKQQNFGKIINIASMYGMIAPDFDLYATAPASLNPPHYGAAKAGLIQLTKYYASYLGKHNIQVNAISPGPFPALHVQNSHKEFVEQLAQHTLLNRIGRPEDLIGVIVLLSSRASDYISGQNFVVDGGWTSK